MLVVVGICREDVETSVTVTNNSRFHDYPHPDDHTTQLTVTPGFKPFTVIIIIIIIIIIILIIKLII